MMPTSELNKERLQTIASWRAKYSAGHNVVLPAEEAEMMARALLAVMEQEPFGFVTKRCAEHMHDNDHDENNWMWSISAVVIGCDPKLKHEVPVYLYPAASIPSAGSQDFKPSDLEHM
jgi:hypothetical protein